ncbi:hypothetical protein B0A55_01446 [Friedmanniomyces simplex]|uniref:RRM domain-containing protein n=1 Tax=Friedmanniomyces simplex TaxID=329884 RepID=A0A4U0Y1T2_9PEZI|nr:hypothetical protein B0A55_01446 [Friedmanniomyces simplex]
MATQTVAKSASKPAPLKSALKRTVPKDEVAGKKAKTGETSEEQSVKQRTVGEKSVREKAVKEKPVKVSKESVKEKSVKASKVKAPKQPAEEVAEPADAPAALQDAADRGAALAEDQTAALIAGFSSSEDESEDDEADGVAISKLPQVPSLGDVQQRIKDATTADPERTPGVVYVGRIPHGFYEPQMRAYFSQFGTISNMRLARNRKTGKSQHYAFVEFSSKAVAEIVAKTMDKYLLFGHIMQVRTVPLEQIKENMWNGTGRRKKPAPRNKMEGRALKRGKVREHWERKIGVEEKKRAEKAVKLREMGYEFEMPGLKAVSEVPVKAKAVEDGAAVDADGIAKGVEEKEEPKELLADLSPAIEAPVDVAGKEQKVTEKRPSTEPKTKKAKKVKA